MNATFSTDDLLRFLDQMGDRGLMPVVTARALAMATRTVTSVLSPDEQETVNAQDVERIIRRFNTKRKKDLSPTSLKEYARRFRRTVGLYLDYRSNPANFSIKTRTTAARSMHAQQRNEEAGLSGKVEPRTLNPGTYDSSVPIRPGVVVTIQNLPHDLTKAEAERLAAFVKLLAIGKEGKH